MHLDSSLFPLPSSLKSVVLIINIHFEQLRHAVFVVRHNVHVSHAGRHEAAHALCQMHLLYLRLLAFPRPYHDVAAALKTHIHHEAVILIQLSVEGTVHLQQLHRKEPVLCQQHRIVHLARVVRAVVVLHLIVQRLRCQRRVQCPRLAVKSRTVIVEYTVCQVRTLLHLSQQRTAAYRMDASRRNVEHVALLHVVRRQHVTDAAVLYALAIFIFRYQTLKAAVELSSRLCVHNIPHLRLAERVVIFTCHLVVGMHLYRQVLRSVDKLYQQRKRLAVHVIHRASYQLFLIFRHKLVKLASLQRTVAHYRFLARYGTYLPALAYRGCVAVVYAFQGFQQISAPDL